MFSNHKSHVSLLLYRCSQKSHHQKSLTTNISWQAHPHRVMMSLVKQSSRNMYKCLSGPYNEMQIRVMVVRLPVEVHYPRPSGVDQKKKNNKTKKNTLYTQLSRKTVQTSQILRPKGTREKVASTNILGLAEGEASLTMPTSYILIEYLQTV